MSGGRSKIEKLEQSGNSCALIAFQDIYHYLIRSGIQERCYIEVYKPKFQSIPSTLIVK